MDRLDSTSRSQRDLELLVPSVVIDEFERNRPRIESSMTASVAERIRLVRRDFAEYGSSESQTAIDAIDGRAHPVHVVGAMTTRNFDEILDLIKGGRRAAPGRSVQRAQACSSGSTSQARSLHSGSRCCVLGKPRWAVSSRSTSQARSLPSGSRRCVCCLARQASLRCVGSAWPGAPFRRGRRVRCTGPSPRQRGIARCRPRRCPGNPQG